MHCYKAIQSVPEKNVSLYYPCYLLPGKYFQVNLCYFLFWVNFGEHPVDLYMLVRIVCWCSREWANIMQWTVRNQGCRVFNARSHSVTYQCSAPCRRVATPSWEDIRTQMDFPSFRLYIHPHTHTKRVNNLVALKKCKLPRSSTYDFLYCIVYSTVTSMFLSWSGLQIVFLFLRFTTIAPSQGSPITVIEI